MLGHVHLMGANKKEGYSRLASLPFLVKRCFHTLAQLRAQIGDPAMSCRMVYTLSTPPSDPYAFF